MSVLRVSTLVLFIKVHESHLVSVIAELMTAVSDYSEEKRTLVLGALKKIQDLSTISNAPTLSLKLVAADINVMGYETSEDIGGKMYAKLKELPGLKSNRGWPSYITWYLYTEVYQTL